MALAIVVVLAIPFFNSQPGALRLPQPTIFQPPLPSGALRIAALGDSLTEGVGDSRGNGYPDRLIEQIAASRPGSIIDNYGRSGWTSTELIEGVNGERGQLEAAVATRPDIALIWIGSNDLWQLYDNDDPTSADEDQDLARFSANIDRILSRLRSSGAKLAIALYDDQAKRPGANSETLPGTTPDEFRRMSRQVTRYNDAIRQRAAQHGAVLVDFSRTPLFTDPKQMDPDGIHPNDAGYDAVARIWFDAIRPLLS
jgi:lysophospholipase L1-like esterase